MFGDTELNTPRRSRRPCSRRAGPKPIPVSETATNLLARRVQYRTLDRATKHACLTTNKETSMSNNDKQPESNQNSKEQGKGKDDPALPGPGDNPDFPGSTDPISSGGGGEQQG